MRTFATSSRTHAYRSNVVLDASFSSEIVTLSGPAYERLLHSLIPEEQVDEALDIFAADVRAVLHWDDAAPPLMASIR
jgi:hypothetical protein